MKDYPSTPEQWRERVRDEARQIAAESGENAYVLHSPLYAAAHFEYDVEAGRQHVAGTKAGLLIMCPKRPGIVWRLVEVVDPDGSSFVIDLLDL